MIIQHLLNTVHTVRFSLIFLENAPAAVEYTVQKGGEEFLTSHSLLSTVPPPSPIPHSQFNIDLNTMSTMSVSFSLANLRYFSISNCKYQAHQCKDSYCCVLSKSGKRLPVNLRTGISTNTSLVVYVSDCFLIFMD